MSPNAVVINASAIPADTEASEPPPPDAAIPVKAFTMPITVPSSPTNGAVEPVVARMPRPRFSSAATMRISRSTARAEWPAKVFAPYMYIGSGDNFKLTDCDDACGLKHYTLAFIIARQEGRGTNASYRKEAAWD